MNKYKSLLQTIYIVIFIIFLTLIIFINHLITDELISSTNIIFEEETIESIAITVLFILGFIIFNMYKKEVKQKEKAIKDLDRNKRDIEQKLEDAFKYIGSVNIQLEEIHELLNGIKKYPVSKNDFREIEDYLSSKVLSIINADWIIFRIIDISNLKTIIEFHESRGSAILLKYAIANKDLMSKKKIQGMTCVESEQKNLRLRAFCILPLHNIKDHLVLSLKAILNQLEMIFIIYNSKYYHLDQYHLDSHK